MARERQRLAELVADLSSLGREVSIDPDSGHRIGVAVLARLADAPQPGAAKRARRVSGRRIAAVAVVALLSLLAAPAVRAAVSDWFEFAGVLVRLDPQPPPSSAPPPTDPQPTPTGAATSLERARAQVTFVPLVPRELGPPQAVEVSPDRRVLSMSWTGGPDGPVRLDQFDGRLDPLFAKTAPAAEYLTIEGGPALWFETPHEVVVLDAAGRERRETARLAGRTLIWESGETTLRLEGDLSRARAVEIARSAAGSR